MKEPSFFLWVSPRHLNFVPIHAFLRQNCFSSQKKKKNNWKMLLLLLRYDCYLLCNPLTCHSGSDAFSGVFFVHLNTNSIKEFFQQTCRATRVGQALVFLLQRISKRTTIEAVTTKGISRMWFGIFCFMGLHSLHPLHRYLAVEQRTWGCHFAWHQQRHRADSVNVERSQVERGLFPLGSGDGNKPAQARQENTGRQAELIYTVTSSVYMSIWHKKTRHAL